MQLTNESKKRLKEAATVMKKYEGYSYKIQGHTDNRGNENFNIRLSGKRAEAVKSYLVSQGVDAAILSTEGFGSAQPIANNDTREGRIQNRRVVFEIVK
jgi:OOP family OmpA-OmpF porin